MSNQDNEDADKRHLRRTLNQEAQLVEDFAQIIRQTLITAANAEKRLSPEMQAQLETAASALNAWTSKPQSSGTVVSLYAAAVTSGSGPAASVDDLSEKE